MTRHALRTLIKQGHPGAMAALGYAPDAPITVEALTLSPDPVAIGDRAVLNIALSAPETVPVLVDYVLWFHRPNGAEASKVFKVKQAEITPGKTLTLSKTHVFKGNATTFTLHPGPHKIALQVNGRILEEVTFTLSPAT